MEPSKKTNISKPGMKSGVPDASDGPDFGAGMAEDHAPRKMTIAENVILTIKILAAAALLIAALWGINHWTSAR